MSGNHSWLTSHNAKRIGFDVGLEKKESVWVDDSLAAKGIIEGYDEKARVSAASNCYCCDQSQTEVGLTVTDCARAAAAKAGRMME